LAYFSSMLAAWVIARVLAWAGSGALGALFFRRQSWPAQAGMAASIGVGFLGLAAFDAASLATVGFTAFFSRRGFWQMNGTAGWLCAGSMATIGMALVLVALCMRYRDSLHSRPLEEDQPRGGHTDAVRLGSGPNDQDPFSDALSALRDILDGENLPHWRNWIDQDLREWRDHRRTDHHRSAYGGMGSLNDLGLLDPWREALFDHVKALCATYADHPPRVPEADRVAKALPPVMYPLLGWRCLACGHAALSPDDRESWLAKTVVRREIAGAAIRGEIQRCCRRLLDKPPHYAEVERNALAASLVQSGINQMTEDGWMRPCPACGSDQSAVYRWVRSEDGIRWVPAKDNLPVGVKSRPG
jgi:hypothetical protein